MKSPYPVLLINDDAEYAALIIRQAAQKRLVVTWVKSLAEGLVILRAKKTIFGVVLDDKGMIEQNGEITEIFASKAITEIRKIRPDITVTCIATEAYPIYSTYSGFNIRIFDRQQQHIEPMLDYMKREIEELPITKFVNKHTEVITIFEDVFNEPIFHNQHGENQHLTTLLKILQTAGSRSKCDIFANLKDIRGLLEEYINILYCMKNSVDKHDEVSFHDKIYCFSHQQIHEVYKTMIKTLYKFLSKIAIHKDPDFKQVPVNVYVHKRCVNEFFEILTYLHCNVYIVLLKNNIDKKGDFAKDGV